MTIDTDNLQSSTWRGRRLGTKVDQVTGELPSRLGRRARLGGLTVATALLAAACAEDKPLNTFEPRGPKADEISTLMQPIWVIMAVVFVAVIGGTLFIALKNRVNGDELDPDDLPTQTHGNFRLEIMWTILPGVLLAVIAVPVVQRIWQLEEKNDPETGLDVMVIGQQWWWEYRYDVDGDGFFADGNGDGVIDAKDQELPLDIALDRDDLVTANELVIPAGEQIDLYITSRDVIHSFWIPRLNGKRDAVPGRIHTWSLQADEPGKYTGWCTEFCGLSHARMRMSAIALDRDAFDTWFENQLQPAEVPTDPEALAGREIFRSQCTSCHVISDPEIDYPADFTAALTSGVAPNLTHFATRSVYAGAIYNQYVGPGTDAADDALNVDDYLQLSSRAAAAESADDYRWNTAELKRWVSNAPGQKDMAPDDGRGMLPFPQLTDEQLDQVVAYLATLD